MSKPNAILLFAAGLGTRMAPLTNTRPKPLVEVSGRPLLDHALDHCDGLKKVVNVHYFADQIEAHVAGKDIQISDERDMLLDTGGGLKQALPLLGGGPAFTLNTDAVWRGPNLINVLRKAWEPQMEGLMLLIPRERAIAHRGGGDFNLDPSNKITRGQDFVYSGAQIIRTERLHSIQKRAFSMWDLWAPMLDAGTLFGTVYSGTWCDVGRPESIPVAEGILKDAEHV